MITSNLELVNIGKNILLNSAESNLPKDSVINVSQLVTLDKEYLDECVGAIGSKALQKLDTGLKIVPGLIQWHLFFI